MLSNKAFIEKCLIRNMFYIIQIFKYTITPYALFLNFVNNFRLSARYKPLLQLLAGA